MSDEKRLCLVCKKECSSLDHLVLECEGVGVLNLAESVKSRSEKDGVNAKLNNKTNKKSYEIIKRF